MNITQKTGVKMNSEDVTFNLGKGPRKRKSSSRRSSILKTRSSSPSRNVLADIDPNELFEEELTLRRKSRRVSFSETYQVKEFPKDSPRHWLKNLDDSEDKNNSNAELSNPSQQGTHIQGLNSLLTGEIMEQSNHLPRSRLEIVEQANVSSMPSPLMPEMPIYIPSPASRNIADSEVETMVNTSINKYVTGIAAATYASAVTVGGATTTYSMSRDADRTQIYSSSNEMELTMCGTSGATTRGNISQLEGTYSNWENTTTKVFGSNTMDRTGLERTRVFGDDLTAGMELTECVGSSLGGVGSWPEAREPTSLDLERTQLFGEEMNAGMELTQCVSSSLGGMGSWPPAHERTPAESECTRLFGDDAAGMEFTECISTSVGRPPAWEQPPAEHVHVFVDDDANMRQTTGITFPTPDKVDSRSFLSGLIDGDKSRNPQLKSNPIMFATPDKIDGKSFLSGLINGEKSRNPQLKSNPIMFATPDKIDGKSFLSGLINGEKSRNPQLKSNPIMFATPDKIDGKSFLSGLINGEKSRNPQLKSNPIMFATPDKIDGKSFLSGLMGGEKLEIKSDPIVFDTPDKIDGKNFLASLFGGDTLKAADSANVSEESSKSSIANLSTSVATPEKIDGQNFLNSLIHGVSESAEILPSTSSHLIATVSTQPASLVHETPEKINAKNFLTSLVADEKHRESISECAAEPPTVVGDRVDVSSRIDDLRQTERTRTMSSGSDQMELTLCSDTPAKPTPARSATAVTVLGVNSGKASPAGIKAINRTVLFSDDGDDMDLTCMVADVYNPPTPGVAPTEPISGRGDPTDMEFTCVVSSSISAPATRRKSVANKTVMFDTDTGGMDLTSVVDADPAQYTCTSTPRATTGVALDNKTVLFDKESDMELTCSVGGIHGTDQPLYQHVTMEMQPDPANDVSASSDSDLDIDGTRPISQEQAIALLGGLDSPSSDSPIPDKTSSTQPADIPKKRLKSANRTVMFELEPTIHHISPLLSRTNSALSENKTILFQCDDAAAMDLTEVVQSDDIRSVMPRSVKSAEDNTIVFSQVNADMEMTKVVDSGEVGLGSSAHLPVDDKTTNCPPIEDKTVMFQSSDGDMELTCVITPSDDKPTITPTEATVIFQSGQDNMEMTESLPSMAQVPPSSPSTGGSSQSLALLRSMIDKTINKSSLDNSLIEKSLIEKPVLTTPGSRLPDLPVFDKSVSSKSVLDKSSLADKSLIEKSLIEKSLTDKSSIDKSLIDKSLIDRSLIDKSLIEKSLIDRSLIDKSLINKSLIDKSLIDKSLIDNSFMDKYLIDESLISESLFDEPLINESVSSDRTVTDSLRQSQSQSRFVDQSELIEQTDIEETLPNMSEGQPDSLRQPLTDSAMAREASDLPVAEALKCDTEFAIPSVAQSDESPTAAEDLTDLLTNVQLPPLHLESFNSSIASRRSALSSTSSMESDADPSNRGHGNCGPADNSSVQHKSSEMERPRSRDLEMADLQLGDQTFGEKNPGPGDIGDNNIGEREAVDRKSFVSGNMSMCSQLGLDKSGVTLIIGDVSDMMLPSEGEIQTLEDYISMLGVTLEKGGYRRSSVACFSEPAPETLSDHLKLGMLEPEVQLYQWACQQLETLADRYKKLNEEKEAAMRPELPDMVKRATANFNDYSERARKLSSACDLKVTKSFKEWRLKMLQRLWDASQEEDELLAQAKQELIDRNSAVKVAIDSVREKTDQLDNLSDKLTQQCGALKQAKQRLNQQQNEVQSNQEKLMCKQAEERDLQETCNQLNDRVAHLTQERAALSSCSEEQIQRLQERVLINMKCVCYSIESLDHDQMVLSFLDKTLLLTIRLGDQLPSACSHGNNAWPLRAITDISVDSHIPVPTYSNSLLEEVHTHKLMILAHTLITGSVSAESLKTCCTDTVKLRMGLLQLSEVVIEVERLIRYMRWPVAVKHRVTYTESGISIVFSNMDPVAKFQVTFDLDAANFLSSSPKVTVRRLFGRVQKQDVEDLLASVPSGSRYIQAAVHAIHCQLFKSKSKLY